MPDVVDTPSQRIETEEMHPDPPGGLQLVICAIAGLSGIALLVLGAVLGALWGPIRLVFVLVGCQATFAVLMSRFSRGLSVLRLRQWMYRRMRRAWVEWSGWSVPASVKYRSARNCASILFSQEA